MSKHTAGPWHWVNCRSDAPFKFDGTDDGHPSLRTVAEFGENKTEVIDGKTYTSWSLPKFILEAESFDGDDKVADARLIAAAPDLLDAAIRAEKFLANVTPAESFNGSPLHQLREAIAKATGSQP